MLQLGRSSGMLPDAPALYNAVKYGRDILRERGIELPAVSSAYTSLRGMAAANFGGDVEAAQASADRGQLFRQHMAAAGQVALTGVLAVKTEAYWGWVGRMEAKQPGFEKAVDAFRSLAPEVPSKRVWAWWSQMRTAQIKVEKLSRGQLP